MRSDTMTEGAQIQELAAMATLLMAANAPESDLTSRVANAADRWVSSPHWEDLVMSNPGLALDCMTLVRFRKSSGQSLAPLARMVEHGCLFRYEWMPHYLLELSLAAEALHLKAPVPAFHTLWSETLFGRRAPVWQWSADDTSYFLRLVPALAAGERIGLRRLASEDLAYLAEAASRVTFTLCMEKRSDQAVAGLFCSALLGSRTDAMQKAIAQCIDAALRPSERAQVAALLAAQLP